LSIDVGENFTTDYKKGCATSKNGMKRVSSQNNITLEN